MPWSTLHSSIERVAKLLMTDAADALAFLAWQIEQDKNPRNARGFFKSKFIAAPEEKEPQQPAHTLF